MENENLQTMIALKTFFGEGSTVGKKKKKKKQVGERYQELDGKVS